MFNLYGMTVQAQQSAVVVNGVTLTPGAPGTNINGSSVSLESGGALDVGTGRFAIPTGSVNGTAILQTFEVIQGKAHRMPWVLVSAAVIVVGLCMMGEWLTSVRYWEKRLDTKQNRTVWHAAILHRVLYLVLRCLNTRLQR